MVSISTCIITKNEENNIADCINSVISVADEIIILDTGSTDKTIEISLLFPKTKVYETKWENDNSKARNACISYASSEWILFLDADERLERDSGLKLKSFIEYNNFDNDVILSFKYFNQNPYSAHKTFFKSSLFKNNCGIKYVKPIHDFPFLEGHKNISVKDFHIIHQNGTSKLFLENKASSYIKRLKYEIDRTNDIDELSYYYKHLGDAYIVLNKKAQALNYFLKSYKLIPDFNNDKYIDSIAMRIISVADKNTLKNFLKKLIEIRPDKYYIELLKKLEVKT